MDNTLWKELRERYAPGHQITWEFVSPLWREANSTVDNLAEYVGVQDDLEWVHRQAYRLIVKSLDILLHGDTIELTCVCGENLFEEYGARCPSCLADEVLSRYGRCDTCGAECDYLGCVNDRKHEIAKP